MDFLSPGTPSFHNQATTPAAPSGSLGNVRNTLYLSKGVSETRLDWASAAGATGYHVYRGTSAGFLSGSPAPWAAPVTSTTNDSELPATIFFYVVLATDGSVDSAQ